MNKHFSITVSIAAFVNLNLGFDKYLDFSLQCNIDYIININVYHINRIGDSFEQLFLKYLINSRFLFIFNHVNTLPFNYCFS